MSAFALSLAAASRRAEQYVAYLLACAASNHSRQSCASQLRQYLNEAFVMYEPFVMQHRFQEPYNLRIGSEKGAYKL